MMNAKVVSNNSRYSRHRATILLVEDEPELRRQISTFLTRSDFLVREAGTAIDARTILQSDVISLALIDIGLGSGTGWDVLLDCHELGSIPAIIITASVDLRTRVRAFSEDAVDYVAKPFFIEELLSRINARLLKQRYETTRTLIEFDDLKIDLAGRTLSADGITISLTEAEFDIMAYLAARPGRAVSRTTLADEALRHGFDRSERTIDSHVSRIRAKLGQRAVHIVTSWGIGWKFVETPR